MSKHDKLLAKVLSGASDANIRFSDLRNLLLRLGFDERNNQGHFIFTRGDIVEILNLQPKGSKAKPYQVKQVRKLITRYRLSDEL
ncbi:MAG: type II toxin-antitoxin system HicA family toxin [Bacteroidota bacterium]